MRPKSELHGKEASLRRRGLITAAATLAAGTLAKSFSKPASAGHDGTNVLHLGMANQANSWTQLTNNGTGTGLYTFNNDAGATIYSVNHTGAGLFGFSYGGDGIQGGSFNSASALNGVRGQAMKPDVSGVYGENTGGGYGVAGRSSNTGVYGESTDPFIGFGVLGKAAGSYAVGVRGESPDYAGVQGFSQNSIGVYAYSNAHYGLYARSPTLAGYFNGGVLVDGNLTATGAKSAIVRHSDGSYRRMYGVESPESWFEDFGAGRLEGGKAKVEIDPDFAELVHADSYQVFLTPYGDCNGLYVSERTPAGFVVGELQGGTSEVEFGYRLVAKRKDLPAPRLERVAMPQAQGQTEPPAPPDLPPPPIRPEPLAPPDTAQVHARAEPPAPPAPLPQPPVQPQQLKPAEVPEQE